MSITQLLLPRACQLGRIRLWSSYPKKEQTASLQKHDMCLLEQINLTALHIRTLNIDIDNLHYILVVGLLCVCVCLVKGKKNILCGILYVLDRRVVKSLLVLVIIIVNQIQHSFCVF